MSYYNNIAIGYNALHEEEQLRKKRLILSLLPQITGYMLDVGCGTGLSLQKNTIGLDPSYDMLLQAKKKKHLLLIQGYGEYLPFKDKSFELVQCITALHNFDDWKKGLSEMKRVSQKWMILSLLKKAKEYPQIIVAVRQTIVKTVEDQHDTIFLCRL